MSVFCSVRSSGLFLSAVKILQTQIYKRRSTKHNLKADVENCKCFIVAHI